MWFYFHQQLYVSIFWPTQAHYNAYIEFIESLNFLLVMSISHYILKITGIKYWVLMIYENNFQEVNIVQVHNLLLIY